MLIKPRRRRGNIEPGVGKWVSYLNREKKLDTLVGQRPVAPVAPKGLYLYGNVGSGKLPDSCTCSKEAISSLVGSILSISFLAGQKMRGKMLLLGHCPTFMKLI